MFRTILKKKNELSLELSKTQLKNERRGVLAINGDNGYPYAIPVNYFYSEEDNKIYFHGARIGYKVELLKKNNNVCFTVYGNEEINNEKWDPYVSSVVVFGKCNCIQDKDKTLSFLKKFACKYYPNEKMVDEEMQKSGNAVLMYEINIEHLSGKRVQER